MGAAWGYGALNRTKERGLRNNALSMTLRCRCAALRSPQWRGCVAPYRRDGKPHRIRSDGGRYPHLNLREQADHITAQAIHCSDQAHEHTAKLIFVPRECFCTTNNVVCIRTSLLRKQLALHACATCTSRSLILKENCAHVRVQSTAQVEKV
jgi:hypothetical protein